MAVAISYVDAEQFATLMAPPDLVLVDFTVEFCEPCSRPNPELNALARELAPGLTIVKVDVDEHQELATRLAWGLAGVGVLSQRKVVDNTLVAPSPEQLRVNRSNCGGDTQSDRAACNISLTL